MYKQGSCEIFDTSVNLLSINILGIIPAKVFMLEDRLHLLRYDTCKSSMKLFPGYHYDKKAINGMVLDVAFLDAWDLTSVI